MNIEKEQVFDKFKEMIYQSWTYNLLTDKEKENLENAFNWSKDKLKGTSKQRWEMLHTIYYAFLCALDYNDYIEWERERKEEMKNGRKIKS